MLKVKQTNSHKNPLYTLQYYTYLNTDGTDKNCVGDAIGLNLVKIT